jgi:hypothetical protein
MKLCRHILICSTAMLMTTAVIGQTHPLLFDSGDILNITISGNIRKLLEHREADASYQNMRVSYEDNGRLMSVPVKIKTRGHFRLLKENCNYPPLMLNFSLKRNGNGTVFDGLNKIKLVTPCQGDKLVLREYLVYKLYNLVTEKSFRTRLVKVEFEDTVKSKTIPGQYGILLEEDEEMARRNNARIIEKKVYRPEQVNRPDFLKLAVFEYLIGNTDWSVQYYQNIKLIATDTLAMPAAVAYDFDHSGIVRAPYAKPAPELELHSTLARRYRGYCIEDINSYADVFTFYNELKEKIYDVYRSCPLIEESYKKATLKFLDNFYETINDPKLSRAAFLYPCEKKNTANVVIRGLKQ